MARRSGTGGWHNQTRFESLPWWDGVRYRERTTARRARGFGPPRRLRLRALRRAGAGSGGACVRRRLAEAPLDVAPNKAGGQRSWTRFESLPWWDVAEY